MLRTLKYYLTTGKYMMSLNLQGQMEYPSFLIGWIFANALRVFVGIGVLKVIAIQFHSIAGWSFEQVAFMYGIGIISHGLSIILFIQTWYVDSLVIYGGFDRMLLRPMSVYFQFCVYDLNLIGITDLIPGLLVFIYGAAAIHFPFTVVNVLYVLITILGATLLRGGIYTIIGSVGFYTKSNRALIDVVLSLFDKSTSYPMTIYNWLIQGFLTFILPLGFIAFYPASSFLGLPSDIHIPGAVPVWVLGVGILFLAIGWYLFNLGLKHYDSAGN